MNDLKYIKMLSEELNKKIQIIQECESPWFIYHQQRGLKAEIKRLQIQLNKLLNKLLKS